MSNRHPVFFMCEEKIEYYQEQAALDAITEMLAIVNVEDEIPVLDITRDYELSDELAESFQDVASCMAKASQRGEQISGPHLVDCFKNKNWQKAPHYDVFITTRDFYSGETTNKFIIGVATRGLGAVLSVHRFLRYEPHEQYEIIKTEMMHEIGHVFGLLPEERTSHTNNLLGKHCTNICVMRQGLWVPKDQERHTRDRLKFGPLCQECQRDLTNFFL